jgi:lipopolysaccharide/colanic/teichoic acid biosynthesis glycosyltransferase
MHSNFDSEFRSVQKTAKRTLGIVLAINILFVLMLLVGGILAIKKYLL